ncbi:MAG: DNA-binding protein Alba [Thermoproteota archaeon]|mgnify:CR=1 FL=1|jgi:DNA-binding protein|uniref:DNA/RNA-binding protein Alba n=1 Tax=Candidatus Methanodesulfokora washburnensis TaxID=2478471 RepID=A0A429GFS3_9CREN|nr:DNA-binding protein Alba [Candidatus Methanodesulfokores washburnensis]PNV77874.1 MAG: DNA-binding protein Alba [Candidatus Korarchaeota archaeon]RSN72612.1 DNA-binding protein Alba [Candidatus Methanodesulfokores washburnensis]RZN59443.1 MAG: DNA-binding protein Alba [Candidatus Methanodesulfokores washburnensis]TDA38623.1 MAG: DNA-binding protein Alba [Candidatus Korarchaeota archaeon]
MSSEEGTVFVGRKPAINYVMAVTLQINRGVKKVVLKARGRAISRAVDVAEIARLKYFPGKIKVSDIRTGTEEIISPDGTRRDISVIEIELSQE